MNKNPAQSPASAPCGREKQDMGKFNGKILSRTITFQVQAERDSDIWLWLQSADYGQPSKTIRTLLGVVARAWLNSAPDARGTMESFIGEKMQSPDNTEPGKSTRKSTRKSTKQEAKQETTNMQNLIDQQPLPANLSAALLEMDKDFG